jgi:hypothetical protein
LNRIIIGMIDMIVLIVLVVIGIFIAWSMHHAEGENDDKR